MQRPSCPRKRRPWPRLIGANASPRCSTLFGLLTVVHGMGARLLEKSWAGIPLTWASVFFLYAVAYPVYGLGWGLSDLVVFFTK